MAQHYANIVGPMLAFYYRKPTNSMLYTVWSSFVHNRFKLSCFNALVFRSKRICSSSLLYLNEIKVLSAHFNQVLSYPLNVLQSCIDKVNSYFDNFSASNIRPIGCSKRLVLCKLPYIGAKFSVIIKNILLNIISNHNLAVDLRLIFVNNATIGSLFPFKDRFSTDMLSHVIYLGTCGCGAKYVGKTLRLLPTRVKEHRHSLTGVRYSSIAKHVLDTGHDFDWDNFKILAVNSDDLTLSYLETLIISDLRPSLNEMVSSIPLHIFK
jgi:hypothetical protein